MAEQLTGLGIYEIFRFTPNWKMDMAAESVINRRVLEFVGTRQKLVPVTSKEQVKIRYNFTFMSAAQLFDFLIWFIGKTARTVPFWLPSIMELFTLIGNQLVGVNYLLVQQNRFLRKFLGHERVYVKKSNDEFCTYQITSVEESGEYYKIYLGANLDQTLLVSEVNQVGLLYFSRFDSDVLTFDFKGFEIAECEANFIELPEEYPV